MCRNDMNPGAASHGRASTRSGRRRRLLIPTRTLAAGSGPGHLSPAFCQSRFPCTQFVQIPTPRLLSWTPSWPVSVALGLGTFPLLFVFTEFANSSLGLKPGEPLAFSIHSPPSPAGLQKGPGNTVGRTSHALQRRAPQPKLPAKPGELAAAQYRPATAGLHHRGPSSTLPSHE